VKPVQFTTVTRVRRQSKVRVKPVYALVCKIRFPICWAVAVGLLALAFGGEERLGSVQNVYDGTLPLDVEVNTFRHIDRVFPSAVVKHGERVFPLPRATRQLVLIRLFQQHPIDCG
jgi:hypothetical protein